MCRICLGHVSQVDPSFMNFAWSLKSSDLNSRPIDHNSQDYIDAASRCSKAAAAEVKTRSASARAEQSTWVHWAASQTHWFSHSPELYILQFWTRVQETRFKDTLLGCRNLKKFLEKKPEDEDTSAVPKSKKEKKEKKNKTEKHGKSDKADKTEKTKKRKHGADWLALLSLDQKILCNRSHLGALLATFWTIGCVLLHVLKW